MRTIRTRTGWLAATLGISAFIAPHAAEACGCFAPPNPAEPVVQAGEQIVFAQKDGRTTMHVRVQYNGPAEQFGWLLPVPAVPDLEVGVEELFTALEQRTRPQFVLRRELEGECSFPFADAGAAGGADGGAPPPMNGGPGGVLVRQQAVGPFDTAVLRADDQSAMLAWLEDNGFFVPDPLGQAVGPYIRPGGYFLALKLQKNRDAGDITPIVLDFDADYPMIPMILTQVGADPDMPVTAYVLGEHRAIPRNYRHTVINDEHIDWFSSGSNYRQVVTAAVDEAEGAHSFVTEFSGSSELMVDVLDGPRRFGDRESLAAISDPLAFVEALRLRNFTFNTTLVEILRDAYPLPDGVRDAGFGEDVWYANLDWFLGNYRERNPDQFEGVTFEIDPVALTDALWAVIVTPTRAAGELFREHPQLTRLFTTLSPEEMTKDPVFSFNPDLPDVDNVHVATYRRVCDDGQPPPSEGALELPDGRVFSGTSVSDWRARITASTAPFSARIEILAEEGAPEVDVDNTDALTPGTPPGAGGGGGGGGLTTDRPDTRNGGCTAASPAGFAGGLALLVVLVARRRRER